MEKEKIETQEVTIEMEVDRLAKVRKEIKELQAEEKALKEKMLADGRDVIPGNEFKVSITTRTSESFNEDAFVEAFSKDKQFSDDIKAKVLETKMVVNQLELKTACEENVIPLDYVIPFSEIKESKVVNVK